MDCGVYHHGILIRIYVHNLLIHLEEVTILLLHNIAAQALNGIGKIEVYSKACRTYTITGIATFLGGTRSNVAGHQITKCGVTTFKIVVTLLFGNVVGAFFATTNCLGILFLLGHPNAAIVAQTLTHKGKFRLIVAMHRDTCGVNLNKTGIGKGCTLLMANPGRTSVTVHGIGRKVIHIAITTCSKHHSMGGIAFQLTGYQIAYYNATGTGLTVLVGHHHQIHHLVTFVQCNTAAGYLTAQCTISTQQQLLTGLTAGIECSAHLCTAKRTVVKQSTVVAGKGNSLRHTLVNNVATHFGQTVHIGLTGTVVTSFNGVTEQTLHTVAVILVILGCIDTTLCSDGVRTARRVLNAENIHFEAHCSQRSSGRGTGQSGSNNNDIYFPLVGGIHQLLTGFIVGPFF